jgi:ADP-ribosyl-[dinitrogen reductase] hydrolase
MLDLAALRPKVSSLLTQAASADKSKPPRAGGSLVDVLGAALWVFATTESFQDGALQAANLGGHSDTVAAAYGQLAGAHYGAHAIPAAWRNGLVKEALIAGFAERLFTHAQRQIIK